MNTDNKYLISENQCKSVSKYITRLRGIEPLSSDPESDALPLSYRRKDVKDVLSSRLILRLRLLSNI